MQFLCKTESVVSDFRAIVHHFYEINYRIYELDLVLFPRNNARYLWKMFRISELRYAFFMSSIAVFMNSIFCYFRGLIRSILKSVSGSSAIFFVFPSNFSIFMNYWFEFIWTIHEVYNWCVLVFMTFRFSYYVTKRLHISPTSRDYNTKWAAVLFQTVFGD